MVAPCIVYIFYHNIAVVVKKSNNIPLCVAAVKICITAILYADHTRIIIDKFKTVALL